MARKTKTLQIEFDDGTQKDVEIKELTVGQIIDFVEGDNEDLREKHKEGGMEEILNSQFLPLCTNLKVSDLRDMAPSDIKEIYEAFMEVNAVFFEVARKTGILRVFDQIKGDLIEVFQEEFLKLPADLSKLDTPESLTTVTPT